MARIAVGGFQAEINSFNPAKTRYADFIDIAARPYALRSTPLMEAILSGNHWGINGFCKEAATHGHELIPTTWAIAQPAAELTDEAFETICGDLVAGISAGLPLDGVFLCLHGAMVTESFEDAESEILRRVRAVAGPIPIVATLDLHANVTAQMVDLATLLIVYRTYPHIDMADCGRWFHKQAMVVSDDPEESYMSSSTWVLLTSDGDWFKTLSFANADMGPAKAPAGFRGWTDDYSNVFQILKLK